MTRRSITLVAVLALIASNHALAIDKMAELSPSDGPGNVFGWSVAIDGDYIVVGAPEDSEADTRAGAAYVFKREGGDWVEQQKLIASDAGWYQKAGWAVAVSGDLVAVGAPHIDLDFPGPGKAYVFRREGDSWVEEVLSADSSLDYGFGISISMQGDRIVVGSPYAGLTGAAYVYRRYDSTYPCGGPPDCNVVGLTTCTADVCEGIAWVQEAELIPASAPAYGQVGGAVGMDGGRIILGAAEDDTGGNAAGAAYVFAYDGAAWVEEDKLVAGDPDARDYFGWSVAIHGDAALVGALGDDDAGNSAGAAYVFERVNGQWVETSKLRASDTDTNDGFGFPVAINASLMLVGGSKYPDPSSMYVFRRAGMVWLEVTKIPPSEAETFISIAAGISSPHLVVSGFESGVPIYSFADDCNGNGVPDWNEPLGDLDTDGDVDLSNFEQFQACMAGPDGASLNTNCCFFDVEQDGDVDLKDYRALELAFSVR